MDSCFTPHEEFVGLYIVIRKDSDSLFMTIKDVTLRLNLPLSLCRGQCYDGASVMSGVRNGVSTKVLEVIVNPFVNTINKSMTVVMVVVVELL